MSNILIIAEKPDVARDISGAMIKWAKEEKGYFFGNVNGDVWVVTSAFGHLLNLCSPEDYDPRFKSWNMEDLPLYFPNWKLKAPVEPYKRERLTLIKKLLAKTDVVVAAGDPDDEGQLLIDEIIDFLGFRGPVKRVLINDSMPDNIRKEFANIRNNDDYRNLGRAANARRMADYCFGVNETRLAGIKLHRKGLAIGRVQTPTLGLVIARDMLIENHVKSKYYELDLDLATPDFAQPVSFHFKADKKYLKDSGSDKILDESFVTMIGEQLRGRMANFSTTVKEKVSNPPLPYNLTALQSDMSRRYGFSMNKTLDLTQSLRGKHAITYNRSDSQYLKEEHYQEAPALFQTILNGTLPEKYAMDFSRHSACFNDSLVTAHHGIIPQKNNIDPDSLSSDEKKVYMAIVERYAMQFMKPLVQKVSTSSIPYPKDGYQHTFEHVAYETVDPGYTKYFGKEKEEEDQEQKGFFQAGKHMGTVESYQVTEKETKPPARYTDGTLASDMASIAKYVTDPEIKAILKKKDEGKKGENGSIGTVATRGVIVDNLVKRGFLQRKGKQIISTKLGREFFAILPESITKADTTAKWWLIQEDIKEGIQTDINAIQQSVIEVFLQHKDSAYNGQTLKGYEEKPKAEGIWNGNRIQISSVWGAHAFTGLELQELFAGNRITFDYNGRPVSGQLMEQEYKGRKFIGFKADEREQEEGYIYGNFQNKKIRFKDTWGGHTFTEEEAKRLLNDETITITLPPKEDGEARQVMGKLMKQTYKDHPFYGFARIETDQKPGYIYGTFKKKDIKFKDTWSGHKFTKEEADALLQGKEITIMAKRKSGEDWEVTGKLKQQTYNGNKFYGFKPNKEKTEDSSEESENPVGFP